jgi:hypothetical protein
LVGRGIFIGDVHGCATELADLFDVLAVTSDDGIWLVGDLVARGPDTKGVLRLVREAGAHAVRGNHEQRLLEVRTAHQLGHHGPRLGDSHWKLFESLTDEEWEQLESLPYTIDVPQHGVRVVHAGLVPELPLEAHEVSHFTRLRTIRSDGTASDRLRGRLWGELYCGPPHVVFGHNAVSGLQLHVDATGLDTGCVYGGKLSALVLPAGSAVPSAAERRAVIVSVRARARYYVPGVRAD